MKLEDYFDAYDKTRQLAAGSTGWTRQRKKVRKALARPVLELGYEHRSIIALSGLERLQPADIARTLGIPVGTVHSRLSRARAKLKELLDAE
jgi:RNA polymerase sigma factor (sigma-70 family)